MKKDTWVDVGSVDTLRKKDLHNLKVKNVSIALTNVNGEFTAVSGECNHAKGPLGKGRMEGDYIVCPWHGWRFHRKSGHGHPPFDAACLPRHEVKEENGHLFINLKPSNERAQFPHPPSPLEREVKREKGRIRVAGISTTAMDTGLRPRYSTSEDLLETALEHAKKACKAETTMIKLRDLKFQHCGGFYSIDEKACTWPCTYSQMDPEDQLGAVYEALVFWADIILIATPIRWGSADSLYYKMAERLNCIQNQVFLAQRSLIKNKVASFIITGGQDNVQAVAGQMLMFFSELGFLFPQYPFVGHSRGWAAEDMENNTSQVKESKTLRDDVKGLVDRCFSMSKELIAS